ncbi:hypothetical protein ANO11243_003550 [Dothideomycetidae sp. 11243]|nr:hypothetical protein ANO11243_003550 [fungal sp. No.11243]
MFETYQRRRRRLAAAFAAVVIVLLIEEGELQLSGSDCDSELEPEENSSPRHDQRGRALRRTESIEAQEPPTKKVRQWYEGGHVTHQPSAEACSSTTQQAHDEGSALSHRQMPQSIQGEASLPTEAPLSGDVRRSQARHNCQRPSGKVERGSAKDKRPRPVHRRHQQRLPDFQAKSQDRNVKRLLEAPPERTVDAPRTRRGRPKQPDTT